MSTSINLRSGFTFVYKYLVNKILAGKMKEVVENQQATTIYRGTQREILRKRSKNNNKA